MEFEDWWKLVSIGLSPDGMWGYDELQATAKIAWADSRRFQERGDKDEE